MAGDKTYRIAIIGTAGRGEDGKRMNLDLYNRMIRKSEEIITQYFKLNWSNIILVSGGAAWSDQIAIVLSLKHNTKLELFFPCDWDDKNSQFNMSKVEGSILNYYHNEFTKKINKDSLKEIGEVLKNDNCSFKIGKGFHDRNLMVGNVDYLIAFSWSKGDVPKKGGTYDTWINSNAKKKIHISLEKLINENNQEYVNNLKNKDESNKVNINNGSKNETPLQQYLKNEIDDTIFDLIDDPYMETKTKKRKTNDKE